MAFQHFLDAQAPVYARVLDELRAGRKRTHWMWFIFPQLAGLGSSAMAQRYALHGLDEARAYLAHPVLGPRLLECVALLNARPVVLGYPDDLKLRSCVTLFREAAADPAPFQAVLDGYYGGEPDEQTLLKLRADL